MRVIPGLLTVTCCVYHLLTCSSADARSVATTPVLGPIPAGSAPRPNAQTSDSWSSIERPPPSLGVTFGVSCKAKKPHFFRKNARADTAQNCGGDAYYVSRHNRKTRQANDGMTTNTSTKISAHPQPYHHEYISLGMAGGLRHWAQGEIDPSAFSRALVLGARQAFEHTTNVTLETHSHLHTPHPKDLMERGYQHVVQGGDKNAGSATALMLVLNRSNGHLETAHLGDTGYVVLRNDHIIFRSHAQTYFDSNHDDDDDDDMGRAAHARAPFHLSLCPSSKMSCGWSASYMFNCDDADVTSFQVQPGDVILIGSHGVLELYEDDRNEEDQHEDEEEDEDEVTSSSSNRPRHIMRVRIHIYFL
jgi:serine/threonine protein phosphatase PrpC